MTMFEAGDRVKLATDVEVYGVTDGGPEWTPLAAGTRFSVSGTRPGLVTVLWGDSRLTLPARPPAAEGVMFADAMGWPEAVATVAFMAFLAVLVWDRRRD